MVTSVSALLLVLLLPLTGVRAQISTPRNPKSAKACALCHYRWIDTFFVEGRGTELVPYQAQKVVATPEMCDSCHDGSIMDSRARMTIGRSHKTDMAPPPGMTIPAIFPLDEQGKVQCATCHTAHGVPSGPNAETTIFMRTSNKDSAMCKMCHNGMDSNRADLNHPMGIVKRPTPQDFLELSAAAGKKADNITCESCHTGHGSTHNALLIKSSRNAGLCLACHTEKSMLTPQGQKKAGHVVNARPVSAKIPEALLDRGARVGPAGEIICNTCHRVHGRQTGQHLLIMEDDQNATLCLACHTDKQDLAETGHNLIKSAPQVANLQGQSAVQGGICSACHLPHKPARKLAPGGDYTTGMCLSCHGKGQFAARPRIFGPSHPLGVTPYATPAGGHLYTPATARKGQLSLPLFDLYGVPSDSGKVTCATCHDPHRRQAPEGKSASPKNNQADSGNLFLRQRPAALCKQCHGDKFAIAGTKHNLLKSAPREVNLLKQTPAEAGLCGNCHLVHGGEGHFLWAKKIPAPENLQNPAVCFSCHSEKAAAHKKQIHANSHPLAVSPQEHGLQTRLPLFEADGRFSVNGLMTCYTCHDPHRWQPGEDPGGPAPQQAEGDAGNSFLRLSNAPAAQLCVDCHSQQAQILKSDHDLNASAPDVKNAQGRTTVQAGTCSACHLVHNGKNTFLLWARDLTAGVNRAEALCRSCHQKTGPVMGKVPEIASHPSDMTFRNIGRDTKDQPGYFPLFNLSDGKETPNGQITCLSCHNGHQWRPGTGSGGNRHPEEGDAGSSFLRNESSDTICRDCHGSQALYRYLYFHDPIHRNPDPSQMRLSGP